MDHENIQVEVCCVRLWCVLCVGLCAFCFVNACKYIACVLFLLFSSQRPWFDSSPYAVRLPPPLQFVLCVDQRFHGLPPACGYHCEKCLFATHSRRSITHHVPCIEKGITMPSIARVMGDSTPGAFCLHVVPQSVADAAQFPPSRESGEWWYCLFCWRVFPKRGTASDHVRDKAGEGMHPSRRAGTRSIGRLVKLVPESWSVVTVHGRKQRRLVVPSTHRPLPRSVMPSLASANPVISPRQQFVHEAALAQDAATRASRLGRAAWDEGLAPGERAMCIASSASLAAEAAGADLPSAAEQFVPMNEVDPSIVFPVYYHADRLLEFLNKFPVRGHLRDPSQLRAALLLEQFDDLVSLRALEPLHAPGENCFLNDDFLSLSMCHWNSCTHQLPQIALQDLYSMHTTRGELAEQPSVQRSAHREVAFGTVSGYSRAFARFLAFMLNSLHPTIAPLVHSFAQLQRDQMVQRCGEGAVFNSATMTRLRRAAVLFLVRVVLAGRPGDEASHAQSVLQLSKEWTSLCHFRKRSDSKLELRGPRAVAADLAAVLFCLRLTHAMGGVETRSHAAAESLPRHPGYREMSLLLRLNNAATGATRVVDELVWVDNTRAGRPIIRLRAQGSPSFPVTVISDWMAKLRTEMCALVRDILEALLQQDWADVAPVHIAHQLKDADWRREVATILSAAFSPSLTSLAHPGVEVWDYSSSLGCITSSLVEASVASHAQAADVRSMLSEASVRAREQFARATKGHPFLHPQLQVVIEQMICISALSMAGTPRGHEWQRLDFTPGTPRSNAHLWHNPLINANILSLSPRKPSSRPVVYRILDGICSRTFAAFVAMFGWPPLEWRRPWGQAKLMDSNPDDPCRLNGLNAASARILQTASDISIMSLDVFRKIVVHVLQLQRRSLVSRGFLAPSEEADALGELISDLLAEGTGHSKDVERVHYLYFGGSNTRLAVRRIVACSHSALIGQSPTLSMPQQSPAGDDDWRGRVSAWAGRRPLLDRLKQQALELLRFPSPSLRQDFPSMFDSVMDSRARLQLIIGPTGCGKSTLMGAHVSYNEHARLELSEAVIPCAVVILSSKDTLIDLRASFAFSGLFGLVRPFAFLHEPGAVPASRQVPADANLVLVTVEGVSSPAFESWLLLNGPRVTRVFFDEATNLIEQWELRREGIEAAANVLTTNLGPDVPVSFLTATLPPNVRPPFLSLSPAVTFLRGGPVSEAEVYEGRHLFEHWSQKGATLRLSRLDSDSISPSSNTITSSSSADDSMSASPSFPSSGGCAHGAVYAFVAWLRHDETRWDLVQGGATGMLFFATSAGAKDGQRHLQAALQQVLMSRRGRVGFADSETDPDLKLFLSGDVGSDGLTVDWLCCTTVGSEGLNSRRQDASALVFAGVLGLTYNTCKVVQMVGRPARQGQVAHCAFVRSPALDFAAGLAPEHLAKRDRDALAFFDRPDGQKYREAAVLTMTPSSVHRFFHAGDACLVFALFVAMHGDSALARRFECGHCDVCCRGEPRSVHQAFPPPVVAPSLSLHPHQSPSFTALAYNAIALPQAAVSTAELMHRFWAVFSVEADAWPALSRLGAQCPSCFDVVDHGSAGTCPVRRPNERRVSGRCWWCCFPSALAMKLTKSATVQAHSTVCHPLRARMHQFLLYVYRVCVLGRLSVPGELFYHMVTGNAPSHQLSQHDALVRVLIAVSPLWLADPAFPPFGSRQPGQATITSLHLLLR